MPGTWDSTFGDNRKLILCCEVSSLLHTNMYAVLPIKECKRKNSD